MARVALFHGTIPGLRSASLTGNVSQLATGTLLQVPKYWCIWFFPYRFFQSAWLGTQNGGVYAGT